MWRVASAPAGCHRRLRRRRASPSGFAAVGLRPLPYGTSRCARGRHTKDVRKKRVLRRCFFPRKKAAGFSNRRRRRFCVVIHSGLNVLPMIRKVIVAKTLHRDRPHKPYHKPHKYYIEHRPRELFYPISHFGGCAASVVQLSRNTIFWDAARLVHSKKIASRWRLRSCRRLTRRACRFDRCTCRLL
jgi:hypothetical protein